MKNNPLLNIFSTENKNRDFAIPFSKIKPEHYLPALKESIAKAKNELEKVRTAEPTFANVIEGLEHAGEDLGIVSTVYFNLYSCEASTEHQALVKEVSPLLAEYGSDVSLDEKLFTQVKKVWDQKNSLKLSVEQHMLLEKTYKSFVRNGALLDENKKEELRKIDQEMALLSPAFAENLLKATNAFELYIDNVSDLAGMPESALESMAHEAKEKGHENKWLITLQVPSYLPVLQYADNRALREKVWKASASKCFGGEFDNQENIKKIVELRIRRAHLLGYKSHAAFTLEERMAQSPETVLTFLDKLFAPSKKAAERDLQELKVFASTFKANPLPPQDFMPWDVAYYSEKLKEAKYQFNEEELRPYFKLETAVEGVFEHARRLYGLVFKEIHDAEVYHPDVKVYEVTDARTGKYVSLFYADFFPRATKKNGAWMTSMREQGLQHGSMRRPHISIVCNFTKPTPTRPSLLTLDEVNTLFHEFGHALHGMLSEVHYVSLAGTNVYWDFVELPSQIMENWVTEKESLDLFGRHYQTGEPLPQHYIEKIKASKNFQSGWASLRQLQFGILDISWHSLSEMTKLSVPEFEEQALAKARILPKVENTNTSCAFSHIFSGGYSAGYYSYKWAEVLDADAFEYFKEKGLFDQEVAEKFRTHVLSRGGSEHPMELYKKFRGREPDEKALLIRSGLIEEGAQ